MSYNICKDESLRFRLLANDTKTPLITGDQPVFNILDDILNEKGEVEQLELYYPITPQLAIDIFFDTTEINKCTQKELCEDDVEKYNSKVIEHSLNYVFSDDYNTLLKYFPSQNTM